MSLDDFHEFIKRRIEPMQREESRLEELRKWEVFATKRLRQVNPRTFEAIATRGDVADYVQSELANVESEAALKRVFDEARRLIEYKAIQATRLEFEMAFADTLEEARQNSIDRTRWATLVRNFIRRYGTMAFRDGLSDGGVDPDELSDDDLQRINELIREQSQYVSALGEDIYKAITDAQAVQKPAMWFNRSIKPFYEAGKLSANANGLYEWVIGATEESCRTCLTADGQRHRLKHWHRSGILPQSNGHKELECKGYNCKCNLVPVQGKARGRLDRIPTG